VIHNGVDAERFRPTDDRAAARRAVGLPEDAFVVGMVGQMKPTKNWPMFFEVAARVRDRCPEAVFVAVGGGPLLAEMQRLAAEQGLLPDAARLLGNRTDVPDVLRACDVGLSTSDLEGMSNAVLEEMASGLAVVATDISGTRELIEPDRSGLLIPAGDAGAAADRVVALCRDPARRAELARQARRRAVEAFSFPAMAARHAEVYRQAVAIERARR
jgi:glycosyltransferase involved in cell wall biosynthesis